MKYFHFGLFTLLIIMFPSFALASITINEVAWMGSDASPNHEWIELYNSSSESVDLSGWVLTDGNNLNINLAGSLSANSYAVLERTSDDTVIGEAFLVYVGALVNTGATLVLRDVNGQIMDQVAGGENWQNIGGDNDTKETAQYSISGWVTDVATPGYKNNQGRVVEGTSSSDNLKSNTKDEVDNEKEGGGNNSNSISKFDILKLKAEDSVLELKINVPDMIYANQPVKFSAETKGVGDTIANSLRFVWNFGDTYSGEGREVGHIYKYAGNYMMVVKAEYGERVATLRKEITVLPVKFSISKNADEDIQINNNSPYEIDMSNYVIKGEKEIVFPANTYISPRATITISKERFGQTNNLIVLYDSGDNILASNFGDLQKSAILLAKSPTSHNQITVKPTYKKETNRDIQTFNEQYQKTQDSFGFSQARIIEENERDLTNYSDDITNNNLEELNNENKPEEERKNNWAYYIFFILLLIASLLVLWKTK